MAGDADSYRYLAESIRTFPDQGALAAMMGLSVDDLARSEAGERRLSAAELRSAMTSLDIAATRLFDGVRPAPPHPRPFLVVD